MSIKPNAKGIHNNPENSNPHQATWHWKNSWNTDTYLKLTCTTPRGRVRAESKLSKNYPVTKQMQNDFDIRNQIKHYVRTPLHNPQPPHTNAQEVTAGQHCFVRNFALITFSHI